ncbi:MAG TPA: TauD/TfdA family dioxygenase [Myxococcota bacterium]|jgi:taurine dioxygenase
MALAFEPIAGALGAEVRGIDLAQPLDPVTRKELNEGWLRHQVLFFRDQQISVDQHKAFARNFGELHVHPVLQPMAEQGHPEIVVLESDASRPFVADRWHSDVTFEQAPPKGSILRGVAVPTAGGDTMWASMYGAFEALSDRMQRLLSELTALHDGGGFARMARDKAQLADLERRQKAVHPVIRRHPETGRRALFVNSIFTKQIVGMKPAESEALLGFLHRHVESPDFSCRFRWRPGSLAMWDNRCTQHRVVGDALPEYRRMERVTLIGDVPVG